MATQRVVADITYEWMPFLLDGQHLNFAEHCTSRLVSNSCSHWGPAVYKWEGHVTSGPQAGKTGMLIGETDDLRQRIKQYVAGTQERGNRLWRETFLRLGDIQLWILRLHAVSLQDGDQSLGISLSELFTNSNRRLVVEQLLVMQAVHTALGDVWIVNARH